ncbi:hypothetical protein BSKO_02651 [Bryopsis sp. KO-2023]|nr:hypothetical protein BSKO_02651 [Bryopsis sp. KO-2023]
MSGTEADNVEEAMQVPLLGQSGDAASPDSKLRKLGAWTKKTVLQHFLPLGFLVALVWAMLWPYPGEAISEWKVGDYRLIQTINVCTIFIISGLTLKTTDIMAALKAYVGFLYGAITILILTPCLGFALVKIPSSTPEFATGLAIFAAVPTTLTSGVTLAVQAYCNGALALMLTVCTNMLGILTTPFAISVVVGGGVQFCRGGHPAVERQGAESGTHHGESENAAGYGDCYFVFEGERGGGFWVDHDSLRDCTYLAAVY